MSLIGSVIRLVALVAAALLAVLLLALAYLWISNRDLPMSYLDEQYGKGVQRVEIDGVRLAYRVEGEGPPLVLIHSHFYTMRQWQAWVNMLATDFTVIRYDLTSHGLTGPDPSGDYSRARGAQLLAGLLDHLDVDHAAIAGSSTGGGLAWYFAAHYPQRVDALVLINAPGMPRVTNKYMERGLPGWAGYAFYLLPEQIFKPFLQAPVVDKSLISDDMVHEFHQMYRGEGNRMAEFHRMMAWERGDISEDLAQIKAPVLILWGEDNPQLPVEHAQQFRDKLLQSPRVTIRTYPKIGHVIPLEAPRRSADDTHRFLLEN